MTRFVIIVSLLFHFNSSLFAQSIPSPKEHFGFEIGDDYQLTNYTKTAAYFEKLAAVSNRTKLVNMGPTEEGRPQYMVIVSSPENIRNLDRYKEISQQMARAENLNEAEAKRLAAQGRAIVWIDGGLHANEFGATHQIINAVYEFVKRDDVETLRILDSTIILFVQANPDGQELTSNWYMREKDVKKRNNKTPGLYQKYIGHDNNRDFFTLNMKETRNMCRQLYIEWLPQIVYNHHQSGPPGSVVAGPPYRDPFNFVYDPMLITSLEAIGAAMENRLLHENKPGYTKRNGSQYSTWWNGGLRTTPYFHNMIGIVTELIGRPEPTKVPLVLSRLVPNDGTPFPVEPQEWTFRRTMEYSLSLNYGVLSYATNSKADLLLNIYRMGRNSIERGSRDNWTLSPSKIDSISNLVKRNHRNTAPGQQMPSTDRLPDSLQTKYFNAVMRDKTMRDPRGYIIPADQPDFTTAVRFINSLIGNGILVHKAVKPFSVNDKQYPAGSFIVKTAQAFRPHVLDMFEPQDHPNDLAYPGGPPVKPFDVTGWTLAYTMGIEFDRMLDDFTGPFERVPYGEWQTAEEKIPVTKTGYILDAASNASFVAVNDLLKAGLPVRRITGGDNIGSFFVPYSNGAKEQLQKAVTTDGLRVKAATKMPSTSSKVKPLRIALWDDYAGSIASGWTRWLLETYRFPATLIFPKEINAGNLKSKYDVLIFPNGAFGQSKRVNVYSQPNIEDLPKEVHYRLGWVSNDTSVAQIKKFLEDGGRVIGLSSSTSLAYLLGLPIRNALTEKTPTGEKPLGDDKFFIPGSVLRMKTDPSHPAAYGMPVDVNAYFDMSPAFKLTPEAALTKSVKPIAWYADDHLLRSGWAFGQEYLKDGIAAFSAKVGEGSFYGFGTEIIFRGQTHGTFKLLFNTLLGE